jgi:hypothetical protein
MHGAIDREPWHHPAPSAEAVAAQRRRDEVQAIGDRIAILAAHIHAATYRLLVLLREFDDRRGWDGWKSCAQWLSWRTGVGLDAAREKVRVARALPALPLVGGAFERGELSYSKVRAITRIATPATEELLLQVAIHGTASQLERVVRGWRQVDPAQETARANHDYEERFLRIRHDEHGNIRIECRLPAELGARFLRALDAAQDAVSESAPSEEREGDGGSLPRKVESETGGDGRVPRKDEVETEDDGGHLPRKGARTSDGAREPAPGPRRNPAQARADALVLLADSALAAGLPGRKAADTHQVVVHVDAEVLADPAAEGRSELEDGSLVAPETARRLACDASIVTMREDGEGNALSVGRRRRTVPPAIRRALANRDRGCRFPGCHHVRFLEAHHIEHWADGGETKLANLVHLCSFHHRVLHEGGFRIEGAPDGELRFANRHGVIVRAPTEEGAWETLAEEQRRLGIGAKTIPLWNGDPIDYGYAFSVLFDIERRDLERPARPAA